MGDGDLDGWRWVWLAVAVVFGVGELLTGALFLLPFAMGAVPAVVLAWLGSDLWLQWVVFLLVSAVSLVWLRRFAHSRDNESQAGVGVGRLVGKTAIVIDTIDPAAGSGEVRVGSERWRAVTADAEPIAEGSTVIVQEVTGTRLAVSLVEPAAGAADHDTDSPVEGEPS